MKKLLVFLICSGFIFCISATAIEVIPSLTGTSGLIRMPVARVLPEKKWNFGLDYLFDNPSATQIATGDFRGTWNFKAAIGAPMGYNKILELGFIGRTDRTTNRIKEGVLINLKYSLSSSPFDIEREDLYMAMGVENLTAALGSDAYLVASKYFKGGLGLHFGAMFDSPDYNRLRVLGMFGIESSVGMPQLSLMAEVFASETTTQINAGIEYDLGESYAVMVRGLNVSNSSNARDTQSYSVGFCMLAPF